MVPISFQWSIWGSQANNKKFKVEIEKVLIWAESRWLKIGCMHETELTNALYSTPAWVTGIGCYNNIMLLLF